MANSDKDQSAPLPQREVIDPDYRGVDPENPCVFKNARNAKRARAPQNKLAFLDNRASDYWGIE